MQLRVVTRAALDDLVAVQRNAAPVATREVYSQLGTALRAMHEGWTGNGPAVTYNGVWNRLAFLCAHVAPNADALYWLLWWLFGRAGEYALSVLNAEGTLRVCAIGGGPGTELLGVCRFLHQVRDQITYAQPRVVLRAVDAQASWQPTFNKLVEKIQQSLTADPATAHIQIDAVFQAGADGLAEQSFDFYLVNYVISELRTLESRNAFREFLQPIVDAAPQQAVFLAIDMYLEGNQVPQRTRELFEALGVRRVRNDRHGLSLPSAESVAEMEPYASGLLEVANWNLRRLSSIYWFAGTRHALPHPILEAEVE